ncbi:MAG: helix-turn-helix domain-containing protein [Agathobacter sp.]
MNQEKIGKFIALMRREQNLTQKQLAEKIGVSDKTVSKWETGRSMPDNGVLLDLCLILHISVNELLSGECFPKEHYVNRAEENMLELVKKNELQRQKGNWSIFGTILGLSLLGLACFGIIFATGGMGAIFQFIDLPSMLFVIGIPLLVLVGSGTFRDFVLCFPIVYGRIECNKETVSDAWIAMKTVLCTIPLAGVFACVVSAITIMQIDGAPGALVANLAVALLSLFYSVIFEILLIPTAVRLRKEKE